MAQPYSISPGLAIKLAKLYTEGQKLPETDAYLRQVFKKLPAIKPVQQ